MAESTHDTQVARVVRGDDDFVRCPDCGCKSFIPAAQWLKTTVNVGDQVLFASDAVKCLGCGRLAEIPAEEA